MDFHISHIIYMNSNYIANMKVCIRSPYMTLSLTIKFRNYLLGSYDIKLLHTDSA